MRPLLAFAYDWQAHGSEFLHIGERVAVGRNIGGYELYAVLTKELLGAEAGTSAGLPINRVRLCILFFGKQLHGISILQVTTANTRAAYRLRRGLPNRSNRLMILNHIISSIRTKWPNDILGQALPKAIHS